MQKLIVLFVALVLAGLGITPALIGNSAETQVREWVGKADGMPMFTVRVKDYQKGWFSSTVTLESNLDPNYLASLSSVGVSEDLEIGPFTVMLEVEHGPVFYGAGGPGLGIARMASSWSTKDLNLVSTEKIPEFSILSQAVLGFDGRMRFNTAVPATSFDRTIGAKTASFDFGGYDVVGMMDPVTGQADIRIAVAAIAVESHNGDTEISTVFKMLPIEGTFSGIIRDLYTYIGSTTLSIGGLTYSDTSSSSIPLEIGRVTLTSQVDEMDDPSLVSTSVRYDIERYKAQTSDGTAYEGGPVVFDMTIGPYPAALMMRYYEISLNTVGLEGTEQEKAAALARSLAPLAQEFLAASPSLDFPEVSAVTDRGSFTYNHELSFTADGPVTFTNRAALIEQVTMTGGVTVSDDLARMLALEGATKSMAPETRAAFDQATLDGFADSTLQMLVTQGLLRQDGENWTSKFEIGKGIVMVNGLPVFNLITQQPLLGTN